ncbi:uncharacterized protein [Euphorbia lathyris]|uniref:uncharacterized protein n=1 Tax=Euphorbia lathyris TaxID=212925 RepID=UPI0033140188
MFEYVKLVIHHGGKWEITEDDMVYKGGSIKIIEETDVDYLSLFELQGLGFELGYANCCQIWFKIWGLRGEIAYEEITSDKDIFNMFDYNKPLKTFDLFYQEVVPVAVLNENQPEPQHDEPQSPIHPEQQPDEPQSPIHPEPQSPIHPEQQPDEPQSPIHPEPQSPIHPQSPIQTQNEPQSPIQTQNEPHEDQSEQSNNDDSSGEDDSDDEDYDYTRDEVDSDNTDVELELSEEFVDLEGSDDDIFQNYTTNVDGAEGDREEGESQNGDEPALNEEDFREFNESPCDEDDLQSLSDSSDDGNPNFEEFNEVTGMADPKLSLGMRFSNVYVYRKALKEWAVKQGFDYKLSRNTKTTVTAICKQKCGFKVHASSMRRTRTFQIKTFKPKHECPRDNVNRLVGSAYIAEKYMSDLRENKDWSVEAMQMKIQRELGTEVRPSKCYRARRRAAKHFEGDLTLQYKWLYDYAEMIKVANPGSLIKIQTELQFLEHTGEASSSTAIPREIVVFQYMYVRFTAQKQGYFAGMRPLIGLDGCFLKSPMGGQLLCAVARDGNENMFPLAIGCVDIECKASWQWFLELLVSDFGTPQETKWVFMSDQQKGLVEAMNTVMPGIEHRFCVRHMWENMKLQFKRTEYKNLLWRAAGAGTERSWEFHMQAIKNLDESAYNWVMKHDPKTWARCHFSTHTKSDALQNNICESFNTYIKLARNLPVLSMFEWIRKRIMKRYHIKSEGMKRYKGDICPAYQEQLEKLKVDARNCFCTAAGQDKYSVDCYDTTSVVDLGAKTCSCRL